MGGDLLGVKLPEGRTWVHELTYQAGTWKAPCRVALGKWRITVWLPADRSSLWADLARAVEALVLVRGSPAP